MAHYLSQVTLNKLDQRREDVEFNEAGRRAGIEAFRDVYGFFRCVSPAWMLTPTNARQKITTSDADDLQPVLSSASYTTSASALDPSLSTVSKVASMWCGEQDGSITVRNFATGDVLVAIENKPKVFVFALLDVAIGIIWAGLSDGFIRVFDSFTYRLIDEIRGHCGAVTALALASMPCSDGSKNTIVISASNDWTIAVWDAAALHASNDPLHRLSGVCICRLNAHQNAVRCLAVDKRGGGTLFASGADDGSICMWDLAKYATSGFNLDDPDATRPSQVTGHRKAFRTATALAAADGAWPLGNAHKGSIASLLFCGDSEAEVETIKRTPAGQRGRHTDHAHRYRYDAVSNVSDNLTARAKAQAAMLIAQEPRYNKFLLTAGHDGAVRLWHRTNAVLLLEVEIRPCPVTSLLLDTIHGRVWIGGVDSVITVYDEQTFDHIASLHDHSGSYVVNFQAIPGLATTNLWATDTTGRLTVLRSGPQADDDALCEGEEEQFDLIDGLRSTVIHNYELLQDLRKETQDLTAIDNLRKTNLTHVLGSNAALKQRYLVNTETWHHVHLNKRTASKLSDWLGRLSTNSTLRGYFNCWYAFGFQSRYRKTTLLLSQALSESRNLKLRRRYLHLLHDAAVHKEQNIRLQRIANRILQSSARARMQSAFYTWMRFNNLRRENKARLVISHIINRGNASAIITDFWERLVSATNITESQRKQEAALKILNRGTGVGLLLVYFRKWADARPYLKAFRIQRQSVDVLAVTLAHRLRSNAYQRWKEYVHLCAANRSLDAAEKARREREEWENLVQQNANISEAFLDERRRRLAEREAMNTMTHDAKQARIAELQAQINALHRRKFMSSISVDGSASLEEQSAQIINLIKARGVNCGYDGPVIEKARDICAALERGETVPDGFGQTESAQSYSRTTSQQVSAVTPPPPESPRATSPRATSPGSAFKRSTGSRTSVPASPRAEKPPLDVPLQRAMRLIKQRLFDAARKDGYRHCPSVAEVSGQTAEENPMVDDPDAACRHDWAIPTVLVQGMKGKELREAIAAVKEFAVAYDYTVNAVANAALNAPGASRASMISRSGPPPPPPQLRPGLLREFLMNSHVFLMIVQAEYDRAVKLGVTAGDDYKDPDAVKVTPRKRGASVTQRAATTVTPSREQPSASAGGGDDEEASRTASSAPVDKGGVTLTRGQRLRAQSVREQQDAAARLAEINEQKKLKSTTTTELRQKADETGAQRLKPYMGFRVEPGTVRGTTGSVLKVVAVAEGSPAESAGIKQGDIVLRFANYRANDLAAFNAVVARHCLVGSSIPVKILRGVEQLELTVVVAGRF